MIKAQILDNTEIARDVFLLSIPRTIDFKPGQVIRLRIDGNEPRLYSIASGNREKELKILYDIKPEGKVTPLIKELRKGDCISISEAFGEFTDQDKSAFWIANGTGIAPFYAMFRSGLGQGKTLIHGGRYRDSFYFQDEFESFFNERYIRCCSLETDDGIFHGRLTQYLSAQNFLPPDQKYYLCGSAEMVVETRDILISKKIPFKNIISEIYF
ncbi:MAG TPA: FAD-binding oxidoreductase [Bacteroidales bacterium]